MSKCNLKVNYYDSSLNDLFGCTLKILSIYSDYLNLFCCKKYRLMTIVLSHTPFIDFSPDRAIIDWSRYNIRFNSMLVGDEKVFWKGFVLSVCKNDNEIISFDFQCAEKYEVSTYKDVIKNKISFVKLYRSFSVVKKFLNTNLISSKVSFEVDNVLTAVRQKDHTMIKKCISKNIGLGTGSTPEFDDFLCGMLVALELYKRSSVNDTKNAEQLLEVIKQTCRKNLYKTTLLSRVFMSNILSGKLSWKLTGLIKSILSCKSNDVAKFGQYILEDGATSGNMFLYGMLKTMEVLNEECN